jgi:hypothetical protein
VCAPSGKAAVVWEELHPAGVPESTQHSNVAPAAGFALNENSGVASFVGPSGPAVI